MGYDGFCSLLYYSNRKRLNRKKKSKIFTEEKLLSKILCNSFHHWLTLIQRKHVWYK